MATRKPTTPPPAGPTCPGCQRLAADLTRLQRQLKKQATELRSLENMLRQLAADLAASHEQNHRLTEALNYQRFTQPYLLHLFGQHLPQGNVLAAGLSHLN